jgi:hypothetical protein
MACCDFAPRITEIRFWCPVISIEATAYLQNMKKNGGWTQKIYFQDPMVVCEECAQTMRICLAFYGLLARVHSTPRPLQVKAH